MCICAVHVVSNTENKVHMPIENIAYRILWGLHAVERIVNY